MTPASNSLQEKKWKNQLKWATFKVLLKVIEVLKGATKSTSPPRPSFHPFQITLSPNATFFQTASLSASPHIEEVGRAKKGEKQEVEIVLYI